MEQEKLVEKVPAPRSRKKIFVVVILCIFLSSLGGVWYYMESQKYVYTDKAEVAAPVITFTPHEQGIVKKMFVEEGQHVEAHEVLARVGTEILSSEIAGVIIHADKVYGKIIHPGESVVSMIDPKELKIVARVDEDKGLRDIHVGQQVLFTLDAFGSTEFVGTVATIAPSKREGDVVFSISDKREAKQFEIHIVYDNKQYPSFQNGMSARVWIRK